VSGTAADGRAWGQVSRNIVRARLARRVLELQRIGGETWERDAKDARWPDGRMPLRKRQGGEAMGPVCGG